MSVSIVAAGQDAPKPLSIVVEPLGDDGKGVVARVLFQFANPRAITQAGCFSKGRICRPATCRAISVSRFPARATG